MASPITKEFFSTVQNKMHYATHGNTAAEIIAKRANHKKDYGSYNLESMLNMTRLTKLTKLLCFKGIVKNNHIKLLESNNRNNNEDFVIIISMKGV